jgi:hypothetical protein
VTYGEAIAALRRLIDKLNDLADALALPEEDARIIGLRSVTRELAAAGFWISAFVGYWDNTPKHLRDENVGIVSKGDPGRKIADRFLRDALLTLVHFAIDAAFQNILRAVGKHIPTMPFGRQVDEILKLAALGADEANAREPLNVLTWIRNTIHNNGIHDKAKQVRVLGSKTYEFDTGMPIRCADFDLTINLLEFVIDALSLIFQAPSVAGLPKPIPDRYAVETAKRSDLEW